MVIERERLVAVQSLVPYEPGSRAAYDEGPRARRSHPVDRLGEAIEAAGWLKVHLEPGFAPPGKADAYIVGLDGADDSQAVRLDPRRYLPTLVVQWRPGDDFWVSLRSLNAPPFEVASNPRQQLDVQSWEPFEATVRVWLKRLDEYADVPPGDLRLAIETACDAFDRLLAAIDRLGSENRTLRARLGSAASEIEQLRLVQHALIEELRKKRGPEPRSSRLLAQVAGVLLAIIGGAAGGVAEEGASEAIADNQPPAVRPETLLEMDIDTAVVVCERVISAADQ
jgi:hypothetical protein